MKKEKRICYIVVMLFLLVFAFTGAEYERRQDVQRSLAEKIIRFHVIANSDSSEDQALKLLVRDQIGTQMAELLGEAGSKEACEQLIVANINQIETAAEQVITAEGYDYEVKAALTVTDFPVKTYGDYTFSAGNYEALEVVIGNGTGHNWWCVMYPNMCFSGSVYETVDENAEVALREVLSEEEYEEVLSSGNYQIQFKYLPILNKLCQEAEE